MGAAVANVIIIGGGASGALVAIHLLRAPQPVHVTIIEQRSLIARGFAYGEAAPMHLLNVRAANMSAYPDVPDHLLAWLDDKGDVAGVTGEERFRFVPRRAFGDYLAEQLETLAASPEGQGRLNCIEGKAVSLRRDETGIRVTLEDGRVVEGNIAVLATGYALKKPASIPRRLPSWKSFDPGSLEGLEQVLVIGTGHSAIDHVQLLLAAGYNGKITMLSRHGFLPEVHLPVEAGKIELSEIPLGTPMSGLWRWFKKRVAVAKSEGVDWRAVLDSMRPHAQTIWQSLAPAEQRRFIRHVRSWYDVRRHRLAPSIDATLNRLRGEGRLRIIAGKIVSMSDAPGGAEVVYRRRGSRENEVLRVQGIVECTGFDLNPRTSRNPILDDLLAQGLAQEGAHGFGLAVDANGAVVGADGLAATDLFAVGPITRGQFWEVVGLPDVRVQCAKLARTLIQHHDDATLSA
jgi:uncharacterized NAD(P)/FAD-binding protein YdhS